MTFFFIVDLYIILVLGIEFRFAVGKESGIIRLQMLVIVFKQLAYYVLVYKLIRHNKNLKIMSI